MKLIILKNPLTSFFAPISAFALHLLLILRSGYFLSPEFTLYPYLSSHGFLPYKELVDQHFPTLLFGPISLPSSLTSNPQPLLFLFLFLVLLTDLFFYLTLLRYKVKSPLLILFIYILTNFYFEGNFLWIDSFITLCLVVASFLINSKRPFTDLALGFLFFLIISLKPTTIIAVLFLQFFSRRKITLLTIFGFTVPIIITLAYLFKNDIFDNFIFWSFKFNSNEYLKGAAKFPSVRHVVMVVLISLVPLLRLIKQKHFLYLLFSISLLILAYPRFELLHLQPYFAALFLSLGIFPLEKPWRTFSYGLAVLVLLLASVKAIRHSYGNFYLTPDTQKVAESVKTLPGAYLYVIGGSDLLYSITNRLPPNHTYIPALPWYLNDEASQIRIATSLYFYPLTPIVIDPNATVDGKLLLSEDSTLYKYIHANYTVKEKIGAQEVYIRNK